MRTIVVIIALLFFVLSGKAEGGLTEWDTTLTIVDFVDLPKTWTGQESGLFYVEFQEAWDIPSNHSGIRKRVKSFSLHSTSHTGIVIEQGNDSVLHLLTGGTKAQHGGVGKISLGHIAYEFVLLDPHTPGSDNLASQEPGSMEKQAREVQRALSEIVLRSMPSAGKYDLENQLLSVWFHEEWFLDPDSGQIIKRVSGLSPVIWQRRMTTEGEPVNEAGTGYPVYYKNELKRINLRNL